MAIERPRNAPPPPLGPTRRHPDWPTLDGPPKRRLPLELDDDQRIYYPGDDDDDDDFYYAKERPFRDKLRDA